VHVPELVPANHRPPQELGPVATAGGGDDVLVADRGADDCMRPIFGSAAARPIPQGESEPGCQLREDHLGHDDPMVEEPRTDAQPPR
jgi:hypothetical protein